MEDSEKISQLKKIMYDDYPLIPSYMYEGIANYIVCHIAPGGFLSSIIRNDLKGAVNLADNENIGAIVSYVKFLYNHAPIDCWGGEKQFDAWLAQRTCERRG
jgi:hypothetical protein